MPDYLFAMQKRPASQKKMYVSCKEQIEAARIETQQNRNKSLKAAADYAKALGK